MTLKQKLLTGPLFVALIGLAGLSPPAASLQPIRYERTGGLLSTHDIVEITKDGDVMVDGTLLGQGTGKLTGEKCERLAAMFGDWKSLPSSFPAPPGAGSDAFQVRISYGPYVVSANDANGAIPPNFVNARQAIEQVARDVTGR